MLSKEQILLVTDKALKEVEVPEWGGTVFVKGLTFEDQDYFEALKNDKDMNQKLLVRYVVDKKGNPIFTEEDIPALKKKSIKAFSRIFKEVTEFSSMETAEKNSESTPA